MDTFVGTVYLCRTLTLAGQIASVCEARMGWGPGGMRIGRRPGPRVVSAPPWQTLTCLGNPMGRDSSFAQASQVTEGSRQGAQACRLYSVGLHPPACGPPPPPILTSGSVFPLPPGHWAVVREGLTNPWIPDNWSWGGVASEHCPVLAEFYTEKDWTRKEGPRSGNGLTLERSEANIKHER